MKIIFVRHGESIDDVIDAYGGAADFELSENGIKTANEVAEALKNKKVDCIYSSPLKRALTTAEIINKQHNAKMVVIDEWKERNSYGVFSGCKKEDCKQIYAYLLKDINGKVGDYYSNETVVGAEPIASFDKRVNKAFEKTIKHAEKNGFKNIVVVTHGNVTRSLYKNVLSVSGKVDLDLLAQTCVSVENGEIKLISKKGVTIKK